VIAEYKLNKFSCIGKDEDKQASGYTLVLVSCPG